MGGIVNGVDAGLRDDLARPEFLRHAVLQKKLIARFIEVAKVGGGDPAFRAQYPCGPGRFSPYKS
jgi:hypothetical protein